MNRYFAGFKVAIVKLTQRFLQDHRPELVVQGQKKRFLGIDEVREQIINPDQSLLSPARKSHIVFIFSTANNSFQKLWMFGEGLEDDQHVAYDYVALF